MSHSADVHSLDALKDFRATLCQFGEDASDALVAIQMQIHRMFDWLDDQAKFWQRTIRELEEDVVQAKAELAQRKYPNALGRIPDCTVQEEALEDAQRRLVEAEEKAERVRRWADQLLPYAVTEYDGPSRQLSTLLEGELRQGIALLDRKITTLDEYVALTAPSTPPPVASVAGPVAPAPSAPVPAGTLPPVPGLPANTVSGGDNREPEHRSQ